MKSIDLIQKVITALSAFKWITILSIFLVILSFMLSAKGGVLMGNNLSVDIPYSLSHEEVDLLIEAGAPLTESRHFTIGDDGEKNYINLDKKSDYRINNKIFLGRDSKWAIVTLVYNLLYIFLIVFGIISLQKLLKNVSNISPFTKDNVKLIRRLAYLIFGYAILKWLGDILSSIINSNFNPDDFSSNLSISFSTSHLSAFLFGFLILILAAVFEHGVELKEEAALTI